MFAAATAMAPDVGNTTIRDMFTDDVHALMSNGLSAVSFSDRFNLVDGDGFVAGSDGGGYRARPVVGGHFALMALDGPDQFQ
jgi:hypothetical protein